MKFHRYHKAKLVDNNVVHQGRNIKNVREMLGCKQEALADQLGNGWSQKRVSLLEQKQEVDIETIKEISEILQVPEALLAKSTRTTLRLMLQSTRQNLFDGTEGIIADANLTLAIGQYAMSNLLESVSVMVDIQRQIFVQIEKTFGTIDSVHQLVRSDVTKDSSGREEIV